METMKIEDWSARIVEDLKAAGLTPTIFQGLPVVYRHTLTSPRDLKLLGAFTPSLACDVRYPQKSDAIFFLPRNSLKGLMP